MADRADPARDVTTLALVLAGIGIWMFLEGAAYAVAPDFMRRLAAFLAGMSPREIALSGLSSAIFGAILFIIAVRLI